MAWQARGQSDMILLTAPRACWPALSTGCDMWAGSWAVQSWLCWGTVARLAASVCSFCRWIRDGRADLATLCGSQGYQVKPAGVILCMFNSQPLNREV